MYLSRIVVENVRGFEEFEMSLPSATENGAAWAVIVGDNGTGKTTLLRCIAMGLSGSSGASSLLSELYGEWLRDTTRPALITLELEEEKNDGKRYPITTIVKHSASGEYEIEQSNGSNVPLDAVFVCGYGIGRGVLRTRDYNSYSPIDSLVSLFNYSSEQQNPELILRRLRDHGGIPEAQLLGFIDRVLMLEPQATKLGKSGITVSGPWGTDIPLGALGDGYQNTLTVICDLLHWLFLYDESVFKPDAKFKGIVIIDQLEQHLHPRWQRKIIPLLREQFPRLQFIATTHSPLCAAGTADLPDKDYELLLLRQELEGGIRAVQLPSMDGWRADQILTSEAFGLLTSINAVREEQLKKLNELELKENRTPEEEAEYRRIMASLEEEAPPAGETAMEQKVQLQILELLKELKDKPC